MPLLSLSLAALSPWTSNSCLLFPLLKSRGPGMSAGAIHGTEFYRCRWLPINKGEDNWVAHLLNNNYHLESRYINEREAIWRFSTSTKEAQTPQKLIPPVKADLESQASCCIKTRKMDRYVYQHMKKFYQGHGRRLGDHRHISWLVRSDQSIKNIGAKEELCKESFA